MEDLLNTYITDKFFHETFSIMTIHFLSNILAHRWNDVKSDILASTNPLSSG